MLDRGGEERPSSLRRYVYEGTEEVDERDYLVSKYHTLATLRFGDVGLEYLENLNDQNVLLLDIVTFRVAFSLSGNLAGR